MIALMSCISCSNDAAESENAKWGLSEPARPPLDMSAPPQDLNPSTHEDLSSTPDMTTSDMGMDMRPPLPGEPCTVDGAQGRCSIGLRSPGMEDGECAAIYKPMPELCNGMDDDCDGITDPQDMYEEFRQNWRDLLLDSGVSRHDLAIASHLACNSTSECVSWFEMNDDVYFHQPPPDSFAVEAKRFIEHSYSLGICLTD